MVKEKKFDNIVEKVFGRGDKSGKKVSSLFNSSSPTARTLSVQGGKKGPVLFNRFPAAIDFGTSQIKLMQIAQNSKGEVEVVALDHEPYEDGAGRDLNTRQREAFQKMLKRNSIGNSALIALSSNDIQTYNFVFPPMSDKELEEAIHWKMKPLRPFDLDLEQIHYTYLKWDQKGAGPNSPVYQRVTLLCARRDQLNQKIDLLKHHGIKTVSIDISPLTLLNLKRKNPEGQQTSETVLWIDLGAEETTFVVEKAGEVCFMKRLGVTSKKLTQQLSQYCRIDEKQAESLKHHYGLSFWSMEKLASGTMAPSGAPEDKEDEAAVVFYGLISSLENLVIDIEHSFKYFAYQIAQSKLAKFDRVVLSGGGANLKNLELFLRVRLGVPIEKMEPFKEFNQESLIALQKTDILSAPCGFASVAGLAASQISSKRRLVNLLPSERKRTLKLFKKDITKSPKLVGALAVAVILIAVIPQYYRLHYYEKRAENLEKQLKVSRTEISNRQSNQLDLAEEETKLVEKRTLLQQKLGLLKSDGKGSTLFSEVLAKLSSLVHEEIWISKLSFADKKMAIVGMTFQNDLIAGFIDSLKQSDSFTDVTFNYTQKEPNSSIYRFEVVMSVR